MDWLELSSWMAIHEVETDAIVVSVIIGSCIALLRHNRNKRRRQHRFQWGTLMKRQDREKYQKMQFEDALVDAAMEMYHRGDMSDDEEKKWYIFFAEKLGMFGLKPQKNVKQGIRSRIRTRFGLKPINIPGAKPGVDKVDETYDPHKPIADGLVASRYLK